MVDLMRNLLVDLMVDLMALTRWRLDGDLMVVVVT